MINKTFFDDTDPQETLEWQESLNSLAREGGSERAAWLLRHMISQAQDQGYFHPYLHTSYVNTISPDKEEAIPGDLFMERRIRSIIRWNALAMVMRANKRDSGIGGHIATFASSATLYDVGHDYFFRGANDNFLGDMVFYQGHSSPGMYSRAFVEGRLNEAQLDSFRRETSPEGGLPSYPHPWGMPEFWQFPTVSMGLGPMQAVHQAHVMRYIESQELIPAQQRRVWAFLGDGEMDEPESLGALSLAGREKLDNLTFVVNCNLQRLDGPVRGNSKVIQELEGLFRGAGWNVIKVVWGRRWDSLLAKDTQGFLRRRMEECVDGEYQAFKQKGGAYTREHFFGKYPELAKMVEHLSDDEIANLNRGGHDPFKVYAAYHAAVNHKGQPTVILAKTVKGYGTGVGQAVNKTHQMKKLDMESLKAFRDRFDIPIKDAELADLPYYRPADDSPEMRYMNERREALGGGYLPWRRAKASESIKAPELSIFEPFLEKGSNEREASTTMVFVRMLTNLLKDKQVGPRVVPIIPDEARTFGLEGLFRQLAIYSPVGQKYKPEDADQMLFYNESSKGRILEEGLNEAGAMCSWMAAATSYSNHNVEMVPFYMYYSMFGYQRVGDFCWAAGDMQARGFLLGCTAGRTTLEGEGLQHTDGHSQILFSTIPNCVCYDPTYAYEVAVIVRDGLKRMLDEQQNVFYYMSLMNENYIHPVMPEGVEDGIIRGMYPLKKAAGKGKKKRVQLLGSGTILREVEAAAELLEADFGVKADVWSVTSFTELRREADQLDHAALLNPGSKRPKSWVETCLDDQPGPVIAATDYIKQLPDMIRPWVKAPYHVLGTDGFGRSDVRAKLRHFFEVDRYFVVLAALTELEKMGEVDVAVVKDAIKRYDIDPGKAYPPTH